MGSEPLGGGDLPEKPQPETDQILRPPPVAAAAERADAKTDQHRRQIPAESAHCAAHGLNSSETISPA